jgi:hypothetical protein
MAADGQPSPAGTVQRRFAEKRGGNVPIQRKHIADFNRSVVPTIACINHSKIGLGVDFDELVPALQKFLDEYFVPVWGAPAKLIKARKLRAGLWNMLFLDSPDHADRGDEGYHELTWKGMPRANVFVKPTIAAGDQVSVTACHELCEMLIDPTATLWCEGPRSTLWAYEVCDPVEQETFNVDGVAMSDFVFPAYFDTFRLKKPHAAQYDYLNRVKRPFHILKDGYTEIRHNRRTVEKFGSRDKAKRFAKEDRRWHRSQFRKRQRGHW